MRAEQPASEQRVNRARGASWISLLLIAAFAVLIGAAGYFAFRYVDRSTFNDARAFRVLDELTGQFENFQETMGSLLDLVPEDPEGRAEYPKTLVLKLRLEPESGECDHRPDVVDREQARFKLVGNDPEHSFSISKCVEIYPTQADAKAGKLLYKTLTLSGAMSQLLPAFMSQEFFDVALIGSSAGELLIDISGRGDALGAVQIQQTRSAGVIIADASGLLSRGALEIARNQTTDPKNVEDRSKTPRPVAPEHPVVFEEIIAGEPYRVYVMAFRPTMPMALSRPAANTVPEGHNPELLYMIGLKQQHWAAQVSAGLGPSGSLAITLLVLLLLVLWPFVSLRFAGPQDPIPRMQVVALGTAILLLPAILAVAAVWTWSNLHLRIWADSGAEVYAQQIEHVLRSELSESAGLLSEYSRDFYARRAAEGTLTQSDKFPASRVRYVRIDTVTRAQREHADCNRTKETIINEPVKLTTSGGMDRCPLGDWSPLHTISSLDMTGQTSGYAQRLTAFDTSTYRKQLNLDDREYFKAIKEHEEWRPHEQLWKHDPVPEHGFVAQRLFNRGDAARVLQVAVPMVHKGTRHGLITSDTRAYPISLALRVPLLRFAIVNASNGAVLFHSNDERSLAENFLLETEHDPSLLRALIRRSSEFTLNRVSREDHFDGEYMGTAHHFYYRPVAGVPWGIVVFYPLAEISVVAQQAAIAAIAGYMSIVIVVVIVLIVVFALARRRGDLLLLSLVWPRWEARGAYRAAALCLTVILLALIAMGLWRLNAQEGPGALWSIVIAASCGALCLRLGKLARQEEMSLRSYQAWYLGCMVSVLLLISALPAAWLATSYQDVALRAYLRDQLAQAAADLEQRETVIGRDLRRWVSSDAARERYPTPQVLSRILSSPGYKNTTNVSPTHSCTVWSVTVFDQRAWVSKRGPPHLGVIGRIIWAMSIDSNLQRASRTALPSGGGGKPGGQPVCDWDRESVPYWRRSLNGATSQFRVPVAAEVPWMPLLRDRDIETYYNHSSAIAAFFLLLALVLVLLLVSWVMARRLFGIRIPFASRHVDPEPSQSMPVEPLLQIEFHIAELEREHGSAFTSKDGDDIRMARCANIYAKIWSKRSREEQLLLHQLAQGKFANPENYPVIEKLLYLGYLKLDPWPKISDRGLAAYARHAEKDSLFDEWQRAASASTWNSIRTPLLLLVMVVVGVLMWVAGTTMQILSATLAGMATLFGYVTQVTNLFKKSGETARTE